MDNRPQITIIGDARDAIDQIAKWVRNKGAGTTRTVRCGQLALEIRGMMNSEIEEVRRMTVQAGLDVYDDKEVCTDEGGSKEEETKAIMAAA